RRCEYDVSNHDQNNEGPDEDWIQRPGFTNQDPRHIEQRDTNKRIGGPLDHGQNLAIPAPRQKENKGKLTVPLLCVWLSSNQSGNQSPSTSSGTEETVGPNPKVRDNRS